MHSSLTYTSLTPPPRCLVSPGCSPVCCVHVCTSACNFIDILLMEGCPSDPPAVSGVPQGRSQHIRHPKAALQPQNTHKNTKCADKNHPSWRRPAETSQQQPTSTHPQLRSPASGRAHTQMHTCAYTMSPGEILKTLTSIMGGRSQAHNSTKEELSEQTTPGNTLWSNNLTEQWLVSALCVCVRVCVCQCT